MKIDHIGIAVKSLEEAVKVYQTAVGLSLAGYDEVEEQGVKVAMLDIGESRIELVEPTRPDSPIEKFMAKRGEGIHHIAVQVENIEEALARLKAEGVRLIDRIAFVHPASTHGVLMELVEHGH
jgi:methylmalonyl-CoA epimerase